MSGRVIWQNRLVMVAAEADAAQIINVRIFNKRLPHPGEHKFAIFAGYRFTIRNRHQIGWHEISGRR
jgi:hypothetical protein